MATIDMSSYTDTQDALDNVTRDTTNGDVFEYPDGWSETFSTTGSGGLDWSLYGSTTATAPLVLKGLGANTFTMNSANRMFGNNSGGTYVVAYNINFTGVGSVLSAANSARYHRYHLCTFGAHQYVFYCAGNQRYYDCVFDGSGTTVINRQGIGSFYNCVFSESNLGNGDSNLVLNRCLIMNPTYNRVFASTGTVSQCTFWNAGTPAGRLFRTGQWDVSDCIVSGFTHLADGQKSDVFQRISVYGETALWNTTEPHIHLDVESLSSDPFPNAPTTFLPADVGSVLSNVLPDLGYGMEPGILPYRGAIPGASPTGATFHPLAEG